MQVMLLPEPVPLVRTYEFPSFAYRIACPWSVRRLRCLPIGSAAVVWNTPAQAAPQTHDLPELPVPGERRIR